MCVINNLILQVRNLVNIVFLSACKACWKPEGAGQILMVVLCAILLRNETEGGDFASNSLEVKYNMVSCSSFRWKDLS